MLYCVVCVMALLVCIVPFRLIGLDLPAQSTPESASKVGNS